MSQHTNLTNKYKDLTSQYKDLTSQHNYLTSDGRYIRNHKYDFNHQHFHKIVFFQVGGIDERRREQDGLDEIINDPDANVNIRNAVGQKSIIQC